jgi:glycerol-3-phosphate dehydrogenase
VGRVSGLQSEQFDVVVVGGGIIGCGIARDAALRGLRVALFEKRDFGSGTTSASTRIVHGGLRYLEMLDFRLVRMDLRERETLLRTAPHLVRPLEFMIPFFGADVTRALKLRVGLALYDALSVGNSLPRRRWLSAAEAQSADASLAAARARSAAAYYDARVDSPERLALENVIAAQEHGASALNYCQVTGVRTEGGRVTGVRVRDALDGTEADVTAPVVVNVTGAWFEPVTAALTSRTPRRIRTTKGIHIVVPPLTSRALVLFSQVDRRLLFAIPRGGLTWIGTTDTDYDGDPADARATRADVAYLLASVRHVFPSIQTGDVLATTAGVRALVRQPGAESSVSRMHKVIDGGTVGPDGMISVLGGKITGYRAIAEEATDAVCRRLGATDRRSVTAETLLPGARGRQAVAAGEPPDGPVPSHLEELYGTRAGEVLAVARSAPHLARPLSPKYPDIAAQVVFGVTREHCRRLSDFMRRRTLLGAAADQGWDAARPAATLMGAQLAWSPSRVEEEIEDYRREIAATLAFRH